jgi:acyl-[acyl carrier protein]--UDP-N-acetylglucosamine O-acyltransferase
MNIFLFLFCLVNSRIAVGSQSSLDKDVLHLVTVTNTYNVFNTLNLVLMFSFFWFAPPV